jgi:drug/metabolite transporter (DMT)-like permease
MTNPQAMLAALAAFFFWVLYDTTVKFGQQPPVSPFLVMAIVGFVSASSLTLFAAFTKTLPVLRPTRWREQGFTAALAALVIFSNIVAVKHLPLTLFYVIIFTAPLIIAGLSAFLKHEILTPVKIACLVAGFIGTVIAIGVKGGNSDMIGIIAVFFGTMGFSARALMVRHMGKTVTPESTLILCNFAVALTGIFGFLSSPSGADIETRAVLIFILSGVTSAVGSILYFRAIQNTLSTTVAQFHYTQIIFGAIFGYILWHEIPTWNLVVGSIIIIASGLFLAAQANKTKSAAE